jgi:hypothetical protein
LNWGIKVLQTSALPLGYGAETSAKYSIARYKLHRQAFCNYSPSIFLKIVTIQVPNIFILRKCLSEIDSEGHAEAVFEVNIRSNHCLR